MKQNNDQSSWFRTKFAGLLGQSLLLFLLGACTANTPATAQPTTEPPLRETYQNPVIQVNDPDTWPDYGVGDPFVMRWNGRYYLYCSTKDGCIGIQCWTSDDLIHWQYAGLCAEEPLTMSAYAPEVVYENGFFYLYTSPAGNGHYVLKSESPTGPFLTVTENFGLSIDGDVFIDDDGSWYFYCAGSDRIMAYPMTAPDCVDASNGIAIDTDLHGWTEGSMIVKYDDTYYITYTGNHVWSLGYRINYGVSTDSPLHFTPADNNPLLLSTNPETVSGIGHSSTVLGPNLDEYYIVYHSSHTVPQRSMQIDRIFFNGTQTVVLGPTTDAQSAPAMPDICSRFETSADLEGWQTTNATLQNGSLTLAEGGSVLSQKTFDADYTAECNLLAMGGRAGILFGYTDAQNYGQALYCADTRSVLLSFTVDGATVVHEIPVTAGFGEPLRTDACLQFSIRRQAQTYTLFLNRRQLWQGESDLRGGAIGLTSVQGTAVAGFVGGTAASMQSSFQTVYKPAESLIPAITCLEPHTGVPTDSGATVLAAYEGERYSWRILTAQTGTYDLQLGYCAATDCTLSVALNGKPCGTVTLPASGGRTACVQLQNLQLDDGTGTVAVCVESGSAELTALGFHRVEAVSEQQLTWDAAPVFQDGLWYVEAGALTNLEVTPYGHVKNEQYGKYMLGSENWGDYVVEAQITPLASNASVGLCVRVSNPAGPEPGASAYQGNTYWQGYWIGLRDGEVVLEKYNYDREKLQSAPAAFQTDESCQLCVEVEQATIRVWLNQELVLTHTDSDQPFLHGMVGFLARGGTMRAQNLTVRPIR